MSKDETLGEALRRQGVTRRGFLKFCAATASMMALPPSMVPAIAAALVGDLVFMPAAIISSQSIASFLERRLRGRSEPALSR